MAQQQGFLLEYETAKEEQRTLNLMQKTFLETDLDKVSGDNELQDLEIKALQLELEAKDLIPPPPQFRQGFELRSPFPEIQLDFPRHPYRSSSLPRGINMVSDESHPSL